MRDLFKKSVLFAIAVLVGCIPKPYEKLEGPYTDSDLKLQVDLPEGWRRAGKTEKDFVITREGLTLQRILIRRVNIEAGLPHTKKKLSPSMLPQEITEVLIDDFQLTPQIHNQKILSNTPDTLDGRMGYRVTYSFKNQEGLTVKGINVGVLIDAWHYSINYQAPARYYFVKDESAFEKIVKSFKIIRNSS